MDTQALYTCFEATLQSDPNTRMQAELQLKSAELIPGFIGACLDIVAEPQAPQHIKTATVVYLKNQIERRWDPATTIAHPIEEEEKPVFKERLIPALVKVSPQCRAVLVRILSIIVAREFPAKWSTLLDVTIELFRSSDLDSTRAGLTCLLEMCKHYRWTSGSKRQGLDHLIETSFAGVLNIGNSLVNETSNTAGEMLRDILKIYKCATYQELPKLLQQPDSMNQWGSLMLQVIQKPLPDDVLKLSVDEREINPWVKTKKWAFANLYRLFYRYATPRKATSQHNSHYEAFSQNFLANYVPQLLNVYFAQIEQWVQGKIWLGKASLYNILIFLEECINFKDTWALLKPHTKTIISHVVFPLVCTTDEDIDSFENDPEEYIHKNIDILDESYTPDMAAINFLSTLIRKRSKSTLRDTLEFVQGIVTNHVQNPADLDLARQQEGCLRIMGAIAILVINKPAVSNNELEQFIVQAVFPDFDSPHGFLRGRACQLLNLYGDFKFSQPEIQGLALSKVLKSLEDEHLPVQIEAALALQPMVRHELVKVALSARIPEIMTRLLDLANRMDIDAIAGVIEEFVEIFSEQLTPFAVDLCTKMCEQLMRLLTELAEIQNKEFSAETYTLQGEDKTMTAIGILTTISTLLLALDNANAVVLELENILKPVIQFILREHMSEFYTETFGLVDNCTYCLKSISPTMWSILPEIHAVFKDDGIDFLTELSPTFDNYLQYGAELIGTTPELSALFYDIFNTVMTDEDRLGEEDMTIGCTIAQRFLLSLTGKVDNYVPLILDTVITKLSEGSASRNVPYHVNLLEVVLAALCYNPQIAFEILEQKQYTQKFFSDWFENMEKFTRVYDLKLVSLSMVSVFKLNDQQLPASIQQILGQIGKALLEVVGRLPDAIKAREALDKEFNPSEYPDFAEEEDEFEDELGDEDEEEDAAGEYLDYLNAEAGKFANLNSDIGFYSTLDGLEEEPLSETVLDSVNVFAVIKDLFFELKANQAPRYDSVIGSLSDEGKKILEEVTKL